MCAFVIVSISIYCWHLALSTFARTVTVPLRRARNVANVALALSLDSFILRTIWWPLLYSIVILQLLLFLYTQYMPLYPVHLILHAFTPIAPCFSLFWLQFLNFTSYVFCQNRGNFIATYLRGNINVGPHEWIQGFVAHVPRLLIN